jgi:hypothetical protein
MLGVAIIVVVLVIAIPVGVAMTGGGVAALLGWALRDNGEATHEGSELVELS